MKKVFLSVLCLCLLLTACGNSPSPQEPAQTPPRDTADTAEPSTDVSSAPKNESNILTVFFSVPEDIDPTGVDAVSGASIVVKDGTVLGNMEYMAQIIQETAGGDLFRIETVQQYPLEHEALLDFAADELSGEARPELTALPENLDQYGVIFLGYPNWWADLPMPLYTFLESVDLSGKTVIPFCAHGGSAFSRTVRTITELQPGASVSENGLAISRGSVAHGAEDIADWVRSLGY